MREQRWSRSASKLANQSGAAQRRRGGKLLFGGSAGAEMKGAEGAVTKLIYQAPAETGGAYVFSLA